MMDDDFELEDGFEDFDEWEEEEIDYSDDEGLFYFSFFFLFLTNHHFRCELES